MSPEAAEPTPAAADVADVPDHQLIARARAGDRVAAAELDRRGVEPPMLEPIEPMSGSLDVTTETDPKPGWLREYAGAMKFEAAILDSHVEHHLRVAAGSDSSESLTLARRMIATSRALMAASEELVALADEISTGVPA